ncbi:MAG: zinc-ribbon domain-containing protein [Deltaproteobacteria bacterium]|nr:zinc-ribbon domain-containing protein [Deltaproteobacteria bacterium]
MKHLCEHCGQKYAIPDERVSRKILKIRCQKCQGTMVVDGSEVVPGRQSIPPPVSRTPDPVGAREWFVGIAGRPHGPYTRHDVLDLVDRGEVRARTYMWKGGLVAWHRVNEGAELDWVYGAVQFRETHADAYAYRTPTRVFELMPPSLVTDGRSYFPDPTLHSGWAVLSEEARADLDAVRQREERHAQRQQVTRWAVHAAVLAALTLVGAAGAWAATLV